VLGRVLKLYAEQAARVLRDLKREMGD